MNDKDEKEEIIPPDKDRQADEKTVIKAEIAAQINNFTERPDLLLEVLEKHNPGFIKGMQDDAQKFSKSHRDKRFGFGHLQAKMSLFIQSIAAIVLLGCFPYLIYSKQVGFFAFVGLAVAFAISQSGAKGFLKIVDGMKELFSKAPRLRIRNNF